MSCYQFNRQEILQKAKEKYYKQKAAECYLKNKEVIKEKARNRYISRIDSMQKRSIKK